MCYRCTVLLLVLVLFLLRYTWSPQILDTCMCQAVPASLLHLLCRRWARGWHPNRQQHGSSSSLWPQLRWPRHPARPSPAQQSSPTTALGGCGKSVSDPTCLLAMSWTPWQLAVKMRTVQQQRLHLPNEQGLTHATSSHQGHAARQCRRACGQWRAERPMPSHRTLLGWSVMRTLSCCECLCLMASLHPRIRWSGCGWLTRSGIPTWSTC